MQETGVTSRPMCIADHESIVSIFEYAGDDTRRVSKITSLSSNGTVVEVADFFPTSKKSLRTGFFGYGSIDVQFRWHESLPRYSRLYGLAIELSEYQKPSSLTQGVRLIW